MHRWTANDVAGSIGRRQPIRPTTCKRIPWRAHAPGSAGPYGRRLQDSDRAQDDQRDEDQARSTARRSGTSSGCCGTRCRRPTPFTQLPVLRGSGAHQDRRSARSASAVTVPAASASWTASASSSTDWPMISAALVTAASTSPAPSVVPANWSVRSSSSRDVAGHHVARLNLDQRWLGRLARQPRDRPMAAGVEDAARRRVGGAWNSPSSRIRARTFAVDVRDGRQQRLGVQIIRTLNTCLGAADLHDPAEVHHRDPVGQVAHHAQVVRDQQVARTSS